jgi:Tfp pilus assembly protein PilF
VTVARRAVALDPDNAPARADLGMDLLRTGEEDQARAALEKAFDIDPYDLITYNLLAVLDALQQFDTIRDGDLILRIDRAESAVLKEPVIALAHDALRTLSAKYDFAPRGPILIEIFPHHDDFAVRNLGIPGLVGALGACFGRVVTMDSPKARPPGTFEWGATLWHELTHVITLQMSNQRVPRWLTEGISVYEEQRARPEWRRPMEEEFVRALARDEVPPIREIEGSFADPRTIALAYYQAGLIVGYLIDTYGQAKFNGMVRAFADGADDETAFSLALGVNLDHLQAGFARALDTSFGQLRRALAPPLAAPLARASLDELKALAAEHPDSYDVHLALGQALRRLGEVDAAGQALNRAAALFPGATGSDSPHAVLADMAIEHGNQTTALSELDKQLAQDPVNIELARHIAGIMGPDEDPSRVRRVYERIVALDPFDSDAHATLGRLAVKRGDAAGAVRELRAAVAAGPRDGVALRCELAEAYLLAGDAAQAKRETLAVLERAPSYERAQELLLRLVGGGA